jgi:hypothetical protein
MSGEGPSSGAGWVPSALRCASVTMRFAVAFASFSIRRA